MGIFGRKTKPAPPQPPATMVAPVPVQAPPRWDSSKFKLQLKMAKSRIELQRNKAENNVKLQQRGVARLLAEKKDGMARIRMEQVLRSVVQAEAMEIVELFIELLIARNTLCEVTPSLQDAPVDFREAVTSVVFASHRLDVPELRTVTEMFRAHFGTATIDPITRCEGEFVSSINSRMAQKLNMTVPEGRLVLARLQKVADEYQVNWKAPPEFEDLHNESILDNNTLQSYQPIPEAFAHNIPGYNPGFDDGPGPSAPPGDYNGGGGGGSTYNIPGYAPGASQGSGLYPNASSAPYGASSSHPEYGLPPSTAPSAPPAGPPSDLSGTSRAAPDAPSPDDGFTADLESRFKNLRRK